MRRPLAGGMGVIIHPQLSSLSLFLITKILVAAAYGASAASIVMYWLILHDNWTQAGIVTEKGASIEEMPP